MEKLDLSTVTRWGKLPAWWLLHPEVDADRLAVLAALCTYADENGLCEPSQATLARRLSRSRPWVNRVVSELAAACLLRKQGRSRSNGGTTSCLYQLARTPEQVELFITEAGQGGTPVAVATPARLCQDTGRHQHDRSQINLEHNQDSRHTARESKTHLEINDETLSKLGTSPPGETREVPPRDWLPSEVIVAEALRLCPGADLDEHTTRFVVRCRSKGYRYASLDDAWLEWLLTDQRDARRTCSPGLNGSSYPGTPRLYARKEHRYDRFEAWATAARAPLPQHTTC